LAGSSFPIRIWSCRRFEHWSRVVGRRGRDLRLAPDQSPLGLSRLQRSRVRSMGTSPRDSDHSAIVIKIGAALGVIDVSETALQERLGSVLGAVVDALDLVLFGPEIPRGMADAIIYAVVTTERPRQDRTRCAKTEEQCAHSKYPCIAAGHDASFCCVFIRSARAVYPTLSLPSTRL
jgi:hypothetical protein